MHESKMMNGWERYQNILRGRPADFLPRTPILMQYAAEFIGSDYAAFASDYRILTCANQVCAREFGFDQLSCISDPYRETQAFGATITYVKDGPPQSTHPLTNTKDLSVLAKPDPMRSTRMHDRIMAIQAYRANVGETYSILGWVEGPAAEAADLRGVTNFLMDVLDDIPFVRDLLDTCLEAAISFAQAQIKAGADTIGIGDAIASQVSPQIYASLIQPREKKLVHAIQSAGAFAKLHICGNITHLLPDIADLKVDILDVDHMVDLKSARNHVGRNVVITGNHDPVSVIRNGTPATIRQAMLTAYADAGNPFMVNAGCEIPPGTPPENLRTLCEPFPYQHA